LADRNNNFTLFGEFYGISCKIEKNLTKPQGITNEVVGNLLRT